MLYDISPPVSPSTAVFPGDTPLTREVLLDRERGDHLTLSALRATVHLGSHVDAPSHVRGGAPTAERLDPERFWGLCEVRRPRVARGGLITPETVGDAVRAPRVLFATGTFPDPTVWTDGFAAFAPEAVERLADLGVRLVGIDTPSVDPAESKDLPAHQACVQRDVAILEGLVLAGVPEGVYELVALPLRLVGFDASPVRAVLRPASPPPGVGF